jgi:hypothetical protein
MKTKRRKKRLDGYTVVGPGPLALKNVQGVYTQNAIPQGQYAIVYDDDGESRLQSESTFVSYEQAQATADWLSESLD